MEKTTGKGANLSADESNAELVTLIGNQLRNGMDAFLQRGEHVVICNETAGVLSVLATSFVNDEKDVVFGPASFSQCLQYVNTSL